MISKSEELIQSAQIRFQLTNSEKEFLLAVCEGKDADFRVPNIDTLNNPLNAGKWDESRTIKASLIAWLCIDSDAQKFLTNFGLKIQGAKIIGRLNLNYVCLEIPLVFLRCAFMAPISLERAKIKILDLSGSYVCSQKIENSLGEIVNSSLEARGIEVEKDFFLRNGFISTGCISIVGARIGGNLACYGGVLDNGTEDALLAHNSVINGDVFLSDGFLAIGRVFLTGITIYGSLICRAGKFKNDLDDALCVDGADIRNAVLCNSGFQAIGRVSLLGTRIGNTFDCSKGHFNNTLKVALNIRNIKIESDVLLNNGFTAEGCVNLSGASIGGGLRCERGVFNNAMQDVLLAECSEIKGEVLLGKGFKANGRVSFLGASISQSFVCAGGTFKHPKGQALCAHNAQIQGHVIFNSGFNVTGELSISGATISGNLDCSDGSFFNFNNNSLDAQNTKIKGDVLLSSRFNSLGCVLLSGAIISGTIDCNNGTFTNPEGIALILKNAHIGGSVLLGENFKASGQVAIGWTTINCNLECTKGSIVYKVDNEENSALFVQFADIGGSIIFRKSFQIYGGLSLQGATIGQNMLCDNSQFLNPLMTALNLRMAKIKGSVFMQNRFESNGGIDLRRANISGDFECTGKCVGKIDFQSVEIKGSACLRNGFNSLSRINFTNAFIGEDFILQNVDKQNDMQLDLRSATIRVLHIYKNSWPKKGNLFLDGLIYESLEGDSFVNSKFCLQWLRLQPFHQFSKSNLKTVDMSLFKLIVWQFTQVTTPPLDIKVKSPPSLDQLAEQIKNKLLSSGFPLYSFFIRFYEKYLYTEKFQTQPYEQLAKILEGKGEQSAATLIRINKQEDLRKYGKLNFFEKAWNCFIGLTIAHGYRPFQALFIALILVPFGAICFWFAYPDLISPTNIELYSSSSLFETVKLPSSSNSKNISDIYPQFNPLFYSLDSFVPFVDLHQQRYWLPDANRGSKVFSFGQNDIKVGGLLRYYYWFHILFGWVTTSLLVAGLTGLVRAA